VSGTLAKPIKPTLQQNFAKEPFRLSRPIARLIDGAYLIDKQIEEKNRIHGNNRWVLQTAHIPG